MSSTEAHDERYVDNNGTEDTFDTQDGVRKVIAAQFSLSKSTIILLSIGIFFASFIFSFDQGTNSYITNAAFNEIGHSRAQLAVLAASSIVNSTAKPFFGKLLNVAGRPESLSITMFSMSLGYLICAASPTVSGLSVGRCLWQLGNSGFQIALQVVIADVTNLRYRSLFSGIAGCGWQFVLFYFSGKAVNSALSEGGVGWRGIFAIEACLFLPAILPIIFILFRAQSKARQHAHPNIHKAALPLSHKIYNICSDVDIIGLYLLLGWLVYIFLPIVLVGQSSLQWNGTALPFMMTVGATIILPAFIYWEATSAVHPILPLRFLANRTIISTCMINLCDFISFSLSFNTLTQYVYVATDWSDANALYFTSTQNLCLSFFAIAFGLLVSIYQLRWRGFVVAALCARMLGHALMLYARVHPTTAALLMTQVLQGGGGGVASAATQVGAQGSVPHQDLSLSVSVILLFAEIGSVIGSSVSSALNTAYLVPYICEQFPEWSVETASQYADSPHELGRMLGAIGTPQRDKLVHAFANNMRLQNIPAVVISIIPIVVALLFMGDFRLDKRKNVVENEENSEEQQFGRYQQLHPPYQPSRDNLRMHRSTEALLDRKSTLSRHSLSQSVHSS
ncbi:hypothetical protein E3P77_03506 [Wallemia ichthyophaga]|uniref:Major facilitator superfamily (MFS) profile domain-containing protein n=2 Tax=Wallemia ichthyophaga TaxID=245174 RepID=A0A4T0HNQ1_WALIC|nr:Siderophore iron transporter 3 [Wallemia ichthyophaga EXF-994]TIB15964.1 hypothetical protein E3P90_00589 [Wallemia ichthyophaga]EOQ99022.1 Siderophore iron transporter 3 [Wallemia ichthyophaga EXF-994]TIB17810.1 hypothetical protein E3P93_00446 [Wallemia ichthyophaga]TIB25530.1 hypothetical protein E3P89_00430 [Wallemia ichthyophaga]TIB27022.1 hypothetical protein E3P88_00458 [Wallemia ichthyophaga]